MCHKLWDLVHVEKSATIDFFKIKVQLLLQ